MKAFLLAAGLGTRLRPLTDATPKCLIPIGGKPLMEWWLDLFAKHGVDEVLVNTHYLSEQVSAYIAAYNRRDTGVHVYEFYEPELLGSGGTVAMNRDFVAGCGSFLICYADNLTNINVRDMLAFHERHSGVLTMALFRADNPKQCGIAALNKRDIIVNFVEKPDNPPSNLANAGVYAANYKLFDFLKPGFSDFGKDVLPQLVGNMHGYEIEDYLVDIGTLKNLQKARIDWGKHDHF